MTSPSPNLRKVIQLPRSSTRNQKPYAHVKILEKVRPVQAPIAFEGKVYPPGANVRVEELNQNAVVIECAGPVGAGYSKGGKRDVLWILWKYDWGREEWKELARAQSVDSSWTLALREPAIHALRPQRELVDATAQWQSLATGLMAEIDSQLEMVDTPDIKLSALSSIYVQVAGRIAQQMSI